MAEEEKVEKRKLRLNKVQIIFLIVALVLAGVTGASLYKYFEAQKEIARLSTLEGQQQLAQQEVDVLLSQVSKHMVLPDNEKPTVATVTDIEALKKNQPFFEKAQNGDKVIVYVQARKAIIYSPEKDIIVNVGAVAVDETGAVSSDAQVEAISVEVRNGTGTTGLARDAANKFLSDKTYTVTTYADAVKKDYEQTVVVNLGRSENNAAISALAQTLNAQVVSQLPEGEKTSSADVLIIVGADQATN